MIHRTREDARTDQHVWDGTYNTRTIKWLGESPHHWSDDHQLVIHTEDGDITVRPGWSILRWDDGELTVVSPRAHARVWQPDTAYAVRCGFAFMHQPHPAHTWEPQPGMDPIPCPGFPGDHTP